MTESIQCLAFYTPGPLEIILILAALVLLFGRRLPEIARSMGKSLIEFKKGMKDTKDEIKKSIDTKDNEAAKDDQQQKNQ